jgi:hypothetical protein
MSRTRRTWSASAACVVLGLSAHPVIAQSDNPLRDFIGQWTLTRKACDDLRAETLGDNPVATISRDKIVFGFEFSANVCRLRSARLVQGRVEGRFACVDEQNTSESATLSLRRQGERLLIQTLAPTRPQTETWLFCRTLQSDASVVSRNQASPPSPQMQTSQQGSVEQRALAALADELREAEQFGGQRPRTRVTAIDINGDGQQDALVTIFSSFYGARGCSTEILELQPNGARRLGSAISCELRASGRGPTGWLDLTGGGSKIWRFDGTAYR